MPTLEANIYALWAAKQTAKGTAAATATKRMVQVAGDIAPNRDDGQENFSDLDRFGDATDFVNTIIGEGSPGIQGHPDQAAYIHYLFFGGETVTGSADPWTHVATPQANGGFWSTWWKRVGANIVERTRSIDCRIASLQIEASSGAKVLRYTPTILSLDPGERFTSDPSGGGLGIPVDDPWLYTEGQGSYTINGVVFPGQSAFTATWDEALTPYYGDDVLPLETTTGTPSITVAATILLDSNGHAEYNRQMYGTTAPGAGAKPTKFVPALGTYQFNLVKKTSAGAVVPAREFLAEWPGIKWAPDLAIPPNPDGGAVELGLAGSMRKVTGQPGSRLTIKNGVAAYSA